MTTFNTNTDLNARGRQMLKAREAAETQVWRLVDLPARAGRPDGAEPRARDREGRPPRGRPPRRRQPAALIRQAHAPERVDHQLPLFGSL
jgi:hypothetical protein